jgi:hypothetical protein
MPSLPNQQARTGHYTPITKQLWDDRLAKAEQESKQATHEHVSSRPPEVTQALYPFSQGGVFK